MGIIATCPRDVWLSTKSSRHAKPDVNREVYVERPELEKELRRALLGSLHTIIYGESGCGKSKVLADLDAFSLQANCANALRFGSLTSEIKQVVAFEEPKRLSNVSEEKVATIKAVIANGGIRSSRDYEIAQLDPLFDCFRLMRDEAQWQKHVFTVTMGFAQHVQEYCEQLGYVVEDAHWTASETHLLEADAHWLKRGLSQASVVIASLMNERET